MNILIPWSERDFFKVKVILTSAGDKVLPSLENAHFG